MSIWQAKTAALFDAVLAENINATTATPHMKKFIAQSTQPEPRDLKELDQECRDLRDVVRTLSKRCSDMAVMIDKFKAVAEQVDRIEAFLHEETDGYGEEEEEDEYTADDADFIVSDDEEDDLPALSKLYCDDDVDMDKSKRKRAEKPGPNKRVKIEVVSDDE